MTIEELQEELLKQRDENEQIKAQYSSLAEENKKLKEDNSRLTDYNNKLFMRVSQPIDHREEQTKELSPEEQEELLIKNIRKIMHMEE